MKSVCGADCVNCPWSATCKGCSDEKCFIKRYIKACGKDKYEDLKQTLIGEFNSLGLPGMQPIHELYALVGHYVNLEYPLPGGQTAKLLDDNSMYLGNQVEKGDGHCYGLIAAPEFLLVSEYGENGADPEIVIYKKR